MSRIGLKDFKTSTIKMLKLLICLIFLTGCSIRIGNIGDNKSENQKEERDTMDETVDINDLKIEAEGWTVQLTPKAAENKTFMDFYKKKSRRINLMQLFFQQSQFILLHPADFNNQVKFTLNRVEVMSENELKLDFFMTNGLAQEVRVGTFDIVIREKSTGNTILSGVDTDVNIGIENIKTKESLYAIVGLDVPNNLPQGKIYQPDELEVGISNLKYEVIN